MTKSLGIELTDTFVRVLELEQAAQGFHIVRFEEAPLSSSAQASEALSQILSSGKWSHERVVVSCDAGHALIREISLPFKDHDQIRRVLKYELEGHIQNYTVEELVVDFSIVSSAEKASLLLTISAPKKHVRQILDICSEAGVDPMAVDMDINAVLNVLISSGEIETDDPFLLIHGNGRFAKLVLVEGKKARHIRAVRFSFSQAPVAVAAAGEIPSEGEAPREHPPADRKALMSILSREISRFLLGSTSVATPSHILLSGEFNDDETAQILQEATGQSVRRTDFSRAVQADPASPGMAAGGRIGVPLGLAMKALGRDAVGMDFRQEELVYTKRFDLIKSAALVTLVLINIFLGLIFWDLQEKRGQVEADYAAVQKKQTNLFATIFPDVKLKESEDVFGRMKELHDLEMERSGKSGGPSRSALQVWRDLAGAMNRYYQSLQSRPATAASTVTIESVDIMKAVPNTVLLGGWVTSAADAEELNNAIRTVPLFQDSALQNVDRVPGPENKFRFNIRIALKKDEK